MAGIVGITGCSETKIDSSRVENMLEAVKHRGTHEPIVKTTSSTCFGCIGFSPEVISQDSLPYVIMDGMLYRDDSRQEMSDTDFLRKQYMSHGKEALSKVRGSFACAIIDEDECIIARDHVGSRPLIYQETPQGGLMFASEAKALKDYTDCVEELPPGHYYSSKEKLKQFNEPDPGFKLPHEWDTSEASLKKVRDVVIQAVEDIVTNIEGIGGVSLSGGLDSSIILAVASQYNKNIQAFTSTLKVNHGEDLKYAKLMADYLGVKLHIYEITLEDIQNIVSKAVYYLESYDQDCITGFIANYYNSRLAKEHVDSILVGEGADELFGGYFRELDDISDPEEQERVAKRLVDVAYNTALRRLDRGWMSNSVDYYAPFLNPSVVTMAQDIPLDLKVYQPNGKPIEKWILREAFKDMLPDEITWRPKLRFARGVGVDDQLEKCIPDNLDEEALKKTPKSKKGITFQSPTELYLYNIFKKHFPEDYEGLTCRWDPFS